MLVEFTSRPPAFEIAPTVNGMAICRFYVEPRKVIREDDGKKREAWQAECYEMAAQNTPSLYDRINASLEVWTAKAKEETRRRGEQAAMEKRRQDAPLEIDALRSEVGVLTLYVAQDIGRKNQGGRP